MNVKPIFDAVRTIAGKLTQDDVDLLNRAIIAADHNTPVDTACIAAPTVRSLGEIISHEAIIQEAYKDSVGVWTWGVGVTSKSGHAVERYKDNPQTIRHCLEVYFWLLTTKYLPDVLAAFKGRELTESQLTAALSFHYNTGAIRTADWVESWIAGKPTQAKIEFMAWKKPPEIIERREKERDLFFDGVWSGDGKATVYQVRKPSYAPNWGSAKRVDIQADLKAIAAGVS
jgi:lysozyme